MGSYKMNIETDNKVMNVLVEGNLTTQQAENFIKEYQQITSKIDASKFDLNIDCTTMGVVTKELTPPLENCFELYKSSGFKNVVFELSQKNSTIIKMQLTRLAKGKGLKTSVKII